MFLWMIASNELSQLSARLIPVLSPTYVKENSLATLLVAKRSAGLLSEANLSECLTPLPAHSGFETQRRCYQKSKTGSINNPTNRTYVF